MAQYDVVLEVDSSGWFRAYVPALPGCSVRAATQGAALDALPQTINAYHDWLRMHGEETWTALESVSLNVATNINPDPFAPGSPNALFEVERVPLTYPELERYLKLAAYNRADLLALTRPLPHALRNWKPEPDALTIQQVLRRVGEREMWFVSRLVEPGTPSSEWEGDADMPLFKFLAVEREIVAARLRQLTTAEMSRVVYPAHLSDHPGEAWSARKVARRLLEHEREHIEHISGILALWRKQLLARLTAERAHLLQQLVGIEEVTLTTSPVSNNRTAKDLLAHIGAWDAFYTARMSLVLDGRLSDIQPLGNKIETDAHNAALYEQYRELPLELALAVCLKERSGFLAMLERIPDVELHRQLRLPRGRRSSMRSWARGRFQHDAIHARKVAAWREAMPREVKRWVGPKFLLRAFFQATRKEFLTLVALVPEAERETRPVCGVWTLKDLLGHLVDWEAVGVEGLRQLAAGQTPEFEYTIKDFNTFNNANAAARHSQPWEEVWAEFHQTRRILLALLDTLPDGALERPFITPWGSTLNGYAFAAIWPGHEREHAVDIRHALRLSRWPRYLV